jgi:hypothetical protein
MNAASSTSTPTAARGVEKASETWRAQLQAADAPIDEGAWERAGEPGREEAMEEVVEKARAADPADVQSGEDEADGCHDHVVAVGADGGGALAVVGGDTLRSVRLGAWHFYLACVGFSLFSRRFSHITSDGACSRRTPDRTPTPSGNAG